jgi:protein SCO1/2/putative membrane protein
MIPSGYRLGVWIIIVAVCLGLAASALLPQPQKNAPRAAHKLQLDLGTFELTERSGRSIREIDLANRTWIASFIFTRCPSSCPRISAIMKSLEQELASTPIQLVSITVDPEHDTPEVLSKYANTWNASPSRWWFLTGDPERVHELLLNRFKVPATRVDPAEVAAAGGPENLEEIRHSSRLALVAPGNTLIGYFDSEDPTDIKNLVAQARQTSRPWVAVLPHLNAALNASSAVLLLIGWFLILRKKTRAHITAMIAALITSAIFLACYLVYHAQVGSVRFQSTGPTRLLYFTILISHTVLAIVIVPLIILAVIAAIRKRFHTHARLTRVTLPVWLYVSVTGVIVYWMLYHLDQWHSTG